MCATATSATRRAASYTAAEAPTIVSTVRLWSGSGETSSRRAPVPAAAAPAKRAITSARRPSLTFGTHSMRGVGALFLPGVGNAGEMDHGDGIFGADAPVVDRGEKLDQVGVLPRGGIVLGDLARRHVAEDLRVHLVDDRGEDPLPRAVLLAHGHPDD